MQDVRASQTCVVYVYYLPCVYFVSVFPWIKALQNGYISLNWLSPLLRKGAQLRAAVY